MNRPYSSAPQPFDGDSRQRRTQSRKSNRPKCMICQESFDTLLFAVTIKKGKAHPVCAALKAIGLEQLAKTSGR